MTSAWFKDEMCLKMNHGPDRAFYGLFLSLIFHAAMIFALFNAKPPDRGEGPTEITLIERDRGKTFVTETENQQKDVFDQLKDQADYLSRFTKRVKQQMKARNSGPTRNALDSFKPTLKPSERVGGTGLPRGEGTGTPGTGPQLRQVAIGASSIAEYIPGIQEGAFTALNADQFTYYAFFARMNEQVRNRWVSEVRAYVRNLSRQDLERLSKQDRQTVIEIVLNRSGDFVRSVLHQSSGDRHLDQTTIDAFRSAAPFLNPPREMVEDDGFIRLKYGFHVQFTPHFGPGYN